MRLGILGSTRGTALVSLIRAIKEKKLNAEISLILSNKPESGILAKGQELSTHSFFIDPFNKSREAYDAELTTLLKKYSVDLIVLIGYMRILSAEFVNQWENRIINIHPSLLPKHAGKMDLVVHQAVIDAREKETGCTVHYVTETLDEGPIILQKKCEVDVTDTADSLKIKVQQLEGTALIEAINLIASEIV